MKLEKYGIVLNRLTFDKIEMVRNWRNDPKIAKHMIYRDYITPEMQEKWFRKIDNEQNFYFIIEYEGKDIGLVNIKDIDYEQKTGESGIFIYDDECLNSDISFRTTLCIFDFFFDILKLERSIAHILDDNKQAIKYNQMFGFEKQQNKADVCNQLYYLGKKNYFTKRDFIKRLFH